jgi:hypothetical protein
MTCHGQVSVVCWMWSGIHLGDRPYQPAHVNALRKAVAQKLPIPHRFVCVADSTEGFDPDVEVHLTPPEAAEVGELRSPEGARFPSCYRRLWNFSEGATAFGERLLCTDVDWVPTGDLSPLFERSEDFVGWRPLRTWGKQLRFGGGVYLLTPGTRTEVWSAFRGLASIAEARRAGFRGSDQAWISHKLGGREVYFGRDAGIYSIRDLAGREERLPPDARMVHFNGSVKPWGSPLPWVREHWPGEIHAIEKGLQPKKHLVQHSHRAAAWQIASAKRRHRLIGRPQGRSKGR